MSGGSLKRAFLGLAGIVTVVLLAFLTIPWLVNTLAIRRLNEHFPPRSTADAQSAAIRTSADGLNRMAAPNVAFRVSSATLVPLLKGAVGAAQAGTQFTVDHLVVRPGDQQIRFATHFSGPAPDIEATVSGTAEGTVSVAASENGLVFTPAFDRVQVASLQYKGWKLPGTLANGVGAILTAFIQRINGQIKPVPLVFIKPITSAQSLKLGDRILIVPTQTLTAASILVDEQGVAFLGQINGKPGDPSQTADAKDYATFRSAFLAKGKTILSGAPNDGLALAPDFVLGLFGEIGATARPVQRAEASLEAAWRSVHRLAGPDVSLILPASDVASTVSPMLRKALADAASKSNVTVSTIDVMLDDGQLRGVATGTAAFTGSVPGRVSVQISVSASPIVDGTSIVLVPAIEDIEVLQIETTAFDPVDLLRSVNLILDGLASEVSKSLPAIPIVVPPVRLAPVDLKAVARKVPGLSLKPDTIPGAEGRLAGAAVLVAKDGIQVLADVDLNTAQFAPRSIGPEPGTFSGRIEDLKQVFRQRRTARLADRAPGTIAGDVSWTRLAEIANAHWRGMGGIQAVYVFDTGSQAMTPTEIRLVEKPTYTCSQRHCSFNSCADDCQRDSCDWGCGQGICGHVPCPSLRHPGRFCLKCTGDLACEPNKAACRLAREPKYQACRAACDTKANLEKAACDAVAATDKAGCDLGNAIQKVFHDVGGIGRIGGDGRAKGTVRMDAAAFALTTDRPGVAFAPRISADVAVSGGIDFTPYDIGHLLTCPMKGKALFSSSAMLPMQQPKIAGTLSTAPADPSRPDALILNAHVDRFNLKAKISPPPAEAVLQQNPQLYVLCNPVLTGAITGLSFIGQAKALTGVDIIRALAGKNAAAAFTGDVDYDLQGFDIPLRVDPVEARLGERAMILVPQLGDRAIGLTVRQ